jgi:methyl-accepting chemotaxis protein
MTVGAGSDAIQKIEKVARQIQALLGQAESAISAVTENFGELARENGLILNLVAAIVGRVEGDAVRSILANVAALAEAARGFAQERVQATSGILQIVTTEARLLDRLSELTRAQRSIARETQTLSVLTNIEVARLGELGKGFQYLAHELDEFSQTVTTSIKELSAHTEERKSAIDETRRTLTAGLPRIREEFARIETDLGAELQAVGSSHAQLEQAPAQFRSAVEEIAGQINGVVSAIQVHDITRQQLEHVQQGLELVAAKMNASQDSAELALQESPIVSSGLAIQAYQLRSIEATVGEWMMQIGTCLEGILRISSSDLVAICPLVLEQERNLSAELAHIELLERECQKDNEEVQGAISGLSNLMQLVSEHVEKSRYVRDRLQLLTFNSIIEANHLGTQADAILEISQSIKRVSLTWGELTERSAQAMAEILALVEKAKSEMHAFSTGENVSLELAAAETAHGLANLHNVAEFVSDKATQVEIGTRQLHGRIATAGAARDRLVESFAVIRSVLEDIEAAKRQIESGDPLARKPGNRQQIEALFSESYTTEMEREVLRAALSGAPLPVAQQSLEGNSVELF